LLKTVEDFFIEKLPPYSLVAPTFRTILNFGGIRTHDPHLRKIANMLKKKATALAAWRSGRCIRHPIEKTRVWVPPGYKVF
jgi:hypothetical protein